MATKEEYIKALNGMEEVYDNLDGCMSAMSMFKEGVNLLTGLINEHFEEEETNAEHYLEDLLKVGSYFTFMDGKIKHCSGVSCCDCMFGEEDCGNKKFIWLASPYKKPPYKLTKFENDLLQSYLKGCLSKRTFKSVLTLNAMKEKGYFKGVDENATIKDILADCEVIKDVSGRKIID